MCVRHKYSEYYTRQWDMVCSVTGRPENSNEITSFIHAHKLQKSFYVKFVRMTKEKQNKNKSSFNHDGQFELEVNRDR